MQLLLFAFRRRDAPFHIAEQQQVKSQRQQDDNCDDFGGAHDTDIAPPASSAMTCISGQPGIQRHMRRARQNLVLIRVAPGKRVRHIVVGIAVMRLVRTDNQNHIAQSRSFG
jgi:hypothetical protein